MIRPFFTVVFLIVAAGFSSAPEQATAQTAERCFPETNQCISGRFRQYWEQNGGLPVFGFPITVAANEVNRDTNQTYLTQWFERNRFELHPENPAPYDVLLGRLGDDRLRQQARDWQTFPKGTQRAGCLWFAESGHSVCEPFKTYWETHGLQDPALSRYAQSLALFGLPLSEPNVEANAAGATVLTQWFERARFECHPNNPPEFGVLLGLLGSEVRNNPPVPGLGPQPPACTLTVPPPPAPVPPVPIPVPPPQPPGPPAPAPGLPPSFNNCQADPNANRAPNAPIRITAINKETEVVTLRNVSQAAVNLDGWRMCSIRGNQEHVGIGGLIAAGQTRMFPSTGPGNIWNNFDSDPGALYNPQGQLVSYWAD